MRKVTAQSSNMSPLAVRALMHFFAYPFAWPEPSTAYAEIVQRFLAEELIEVTDYGYKTSPRGRALVHMICSTPFPESETVTSWIDPRFAE